MLPTGTFYLHHQGICTRGCLCWELTPPSSRPSSPRSPLSKASARGGFLSLSRDSSWGLASSISRSSAGLSRPWGNAGASGGDGRGRCAGGCCCCVDVPGTAMLLKSILGRPGRKSRGVGASCLQFCWKNHGKDELPHKSRFRKQQFVSEAQPHPWVTGLAMLVRLCNWSRLSAPFLVP